MRPVTISPKRLQTIISLSFRKTRSISNCIAIKPTNATWYREGALHAPLPRLSSGSTRTSITSTDSPNTMGRE